MIATSARRGMDCRRPQVVRRAAKAEHHEDGELLLQAEALYKAEHESKAARNKHKYAPIAPHINRRRSNRLVVCEEMYEAILREPGGANVENNSQIADTKAREADASRLAELLRSESIADGVG